MTKLPRPSYEVVLDTWASARKSSRAVSKEWLAEHTRLKKAQEELFCLSRFSIGGLLEKCVFCAFWGGFSAAGSLSDNHVARSSPAYFPLCITRTLLVPNLTPCRVLSDGSTMLYNLDPCITQGFLCLRSCATASRTKGKS